MLYLQSLTKPSKPPNHHNNSPSSHGPFSLPSTSLIINCTNLTTIHPTDPARNIPRLLGHPETQRDRNFIIIHDPVFRVDTLCVFVLVYVQFTRIIYMLYIVE